MSVSTYIASIEASRNTIRNKLVELGMAQSGDKLEKLATAIESIINQGAVSVTVQEGGTYTIPAGFHNGSGTVSGVSGGGNYTLQTKTVTPTKKQQSIAVLTRSSLMKRLPLFIWKTRSRDWMLGLWQKAGQQSVCVKTHHPEC